MNGHKILCACESCRKIKGPIIRVPKHKPVISKPIENIEEYEKTLLIEVDFYELKVRRNSKGQIIDYKYFKREECPYCSGYIIDTKLFDRCAKCGKDLREDKNG